MPYQNWTWLDSATEEQMDCAQNKGAIERLAAEARSFYDSIPDPQSEYTQDRRDTALESAYEDAGGGDAGDAACEALKERWSAERNNVWGQIEAIEELMAARGARFARDYEHHNEDEQRIRMLEGD